MEVSVCNQVSSRTNPSKSLGVSTALYLGTDILMFCHHRIVLSACAAGVVLSDACFRHYDVIDQNGVTFAWANSKFELDSGCRLLWVYGFISIVQFRACVCLF